MLVGRRDELVVVVRHLEERMPLLVCGEPGIGKTALLRAGALARGGVCEGGGLRTFAWESWFALERACGPLSDAGDASAVAAEVASRVGERVLTLDDLQWVDGETLALLPELVGRISLVAAVRTGEPETSRARAAAEHAGFDVLELAPLSEADARALVRSAQPELPAAATDEIVAAGGGNPLFLAELATGGRGSQTLQRALRTRLRGLSDGAREALALLSLLGRPAPRPLLGAALQELVAAQVVAPQGDGYALRHDLLGEAAVAALAGEERRRLHARLARVVESPGESARHHLEAGEHAEAHARALEAAERARTPGERAHRLGLAAHATDPEDPAAVALRLRAAAALLDAGEHGSAEQLLERLASADALIDAEIRLQWARARFAAGRRSEAERLVAEGLALARGSGSAVEALLHLQAAEFSLWDWDGAAAAAHARAALAAARRAGLDDIRFAVALGRTLYTAESPECLTVLTGAVESARRLGDDAAECEAGACLAAAHHHFGDAAAARDVTAAMLERARSLRLRGWSNVFRFVHAFQRLAQAGAAADAVDELSLLLQEPGLGPMRDEVVGYLALALGLVGRIDEAVSLLERSLPAASGRWGRAVMLFARSEVEWAAGRTHEGLAAAEACLEQGPSPLAPWVGVMQGWHGRPPKAVTPESASPLTRGAGLTLLALRRLDDSRRLDDAERLFLEAAGLLEGLAVHHELRCLWAAGEAARRAGALERAVEQLLAVEERASALGFAPLLGRVHQSLRAAGVRRSSPRTVGPAGGLTEREREILGLVGAGRTSVQIARALGVAVGTVDSEIRSAMEKLSATTRIQAALLAARPAADTGAPQVLVVVRSEAAARAAEGELKARGVRVQRGWSSRSAAAAVSGIVAKPRDAAAALAAAARGAAVVALLAADAEVEDVFLEDLRRLGPVEERGDDALLPRRLTRDQERLLALIAEGRSVAEAAALLHLSLRTAERRLAAAREALGVRTTAEATLEASR